jgi:hypothetical protein
VASSRIAPGLQSMHILVPNELDCGQMAGNGERTRNSMCEPSASYWASRPKRNAHACMGCGEDAMEGKHEENERFGTRDI